jgi:hypothetical protein
MEAVVALFRDFESCAFTRKANECESPGDLCYDFEDSDAKKFCDLDHDIVFFFKNT